MAPKKTSSEKGDFAVIETGGKQYRVSAGQTITVEKLADLKEGDKVTFDKVILYDNGKETQIGAPYLAGKKVEGTLKENGLGDKVLVVKYKAKSRYMKVRGHRQPYAKVEITSL